jgi:hypothetical protein
VLFLVFCPYTHSKWYCRHNRLYKRVPAVCRLSTIELEHYFERGIGNGDSALVHTYSCITRVSLDSDASGRSMLVGDAEAIYAMAVNAALDMVSPTTSTIDAADAREGGSKVDERPLAFFKRPQNLIVNNGLALKGIFMVA